MLDSSFPLAQTWHKESSLPGLEDAAKEAFGNRPWQDRDWPGNIGRAVSPMDKQNVPERHPVPDYGNAPRHVISYGQAQYAAHEDVDVVQITPTTMTPEAARAYLTALWADPKLLFVEAHTFPSIRLNGAAGYFTVGGPVLAVPVHNAPKPKPVNPLARGRGNYATLLEPVDLTALTPLPVEVINTDGLEDADFAWVARHHASIGPNDIITGPLHLRDITALKYSTSGQAPRGGETLMVKLVGPDGVLGHFADTGAAHEAMADAIDARQYRDRRYLDDFAPAEHFADDYSIVPCLMKDGHEVTGKITSRLTAAQATVYTEVSTVQPSPALPVTGWLMAWHTADWHRNNTWVQLNQESEGPPLWRRDHWR